MSSLIFSKLSSKGRMCRVTYELAKQLKDAGFPQWFHYDEQGRRMDFPSPEVVSVPTLSELIEACGDKFFRLSLKKEGTWLAEGRFYDYWEGSMPEIPVAKLWLALRKN